MLNPANLSTLSVANESASRPFSPASPLPSLLLATSGVLTLFLSAICCKHWCKHLRSPSPLTGANLSRGSSSTQHWISLVEKTRFLAILLAHCVPSWAFYGVGNKRCDIHRIRNSVQQSRAEWGHSYSTLSIKHHPCWFLLYSLFTLPQAWDKQSDKRPIRRLQCLFRITKLTKVSGVSEVSMSSGLWLCALGEEAFGHCLT